MEPNKTVGTSADSQWSPTRQLVHCETLPIAVEPNKIVGTPSKIDRRSRTLKECARSMQHIESRTNCAARHPVVASAKQLVDRGQSH